MKDNAQNLLDHCKGTQCPIRKTCARFSRSAKGFYFHSQYREGECILFIPKKKKNRGQSPVCPLHPFYTKS